MDSDPFAVWHDPDPAPDPAPSISTPTRTQAHTSSGPRASRDGNEDVRVSLDYDDEDPGWGVASASMSRANSPDKATKQAAMRPPTLASSLLEPHTFPQTDAAQPAADDAAAQVEFAQPHTHHMHTMHAAAHSARAQPERAEDGVTPDDGAFDEFGDFDDFETGDAHNDADFGDDDAFGDVGFDQQHVDSAQEEPPPAPPVHTRTFTPLDVSPASNRIHLADSVVALLPLSTAAETQLWNAALRHVEGASQVLVSAESRQLWTDLTSLPCVRPMDWVRSKTRRDYLISMGVPVNLDEIHSTFASGSRGSRQMPQLQLQYHSSDASANGLHRSSSLKLAAAAGSTQTAATPRCASTSNSPRNRSSSPALGSSTNRERMASRRMQELGLAPTPQVDLGRAQELVNKTEDQLTLLSLPALKSMLRELTTLTTSTSSVLTHTLTLRESYQADSEMYNSMIKQLVTGAANRFSGGGSSTSTPTPTTTSSSSSTSINSVSAGRGDSRRSTTIRINPTHSTKTRVNSLPIPASTPLGTTRSASPSLRGGAASSTVRR